MRTDLLLEELAANPTRSDSDKTLTLNVSAQVSINTRWHAGVTRLALCMYNIPVMFIISFDVILPL